LARNIAASRSSVAAPAEAGSSEMWIGAVPVAAKIRLKLNYTISPSD
jgi:hypothetical protein